MCNNKYDSFNEAKSSIISSALGKALSIASDATIATVASTINSVVNRGNLNWSGSNTTYSVSAGYYTGGTLDSRTSYNNGYNGGWGDGVAAADNRANPGCTNWNAGRSQGQADVTGNPNGYGLYTKSQYDANWSNGYNSGYSAGNSAGYSNGYNAGRGDPYKASGTLYMTNGCSASCGWQPNVYNYGTTNSNSLGNQEGTCTISVNGSGFSCTVKGNFLKRNATYVAYHN